MPASPSSSEPVPSSAAPRRAPFYATASARPFSRSALARQSVHSLPSIQHLQHGFAKLGLLAETDAEADKGAPRVGRSGDRRRSRRRGSTALDGSTTALDEHDGERESDRAKALQALGPEPERPVVDDRPAWQRAEEAAAKETAVRDVAQLRSNALDVLDAVYTSWNLSPPPLPFRRPSSSYSSHHQSTPPYPLLTEHVLPAAAPSPPPDLTSLLALTTLAIRSLQSYLVALPSPSPSFTSTSAPAPAHPPTSRLSTAARPRTSLALPFADAPDPSPSASPATLTPLELQDLRAAGEAKGERAEEEEEKEEERLWSEVRRRAWDVLGMVRELEREVEGDRKEVTEQKARDQGEQAKGGNGDGQVDSVDSPLADEQRSPTSPPHSPTGLADGSLDAARPNQVAAAPSAHQTALVQRWADAAAAVLRRSGGTGARRGRVSDASAGGEEGVDRVEEGAVYGREEAAEEEEEEGLPAWAREEGWDDGLARAYAIICAVLSASQTADLPDPASSRDAFLDALSDGVILSHAFNAVLRLPSLSRPFGFLPPASIHTFASPPTPAGSADMVRALSTASNSSDAGGAGGERVGATFRRAENLAQWAAALKHRYALSLGPPAFDARLVAARRPFSDTVNEGAPGEWREMLGGAVGAWAGAAASEAREVWDEERERGPGARGGHIPGVAEG
ncbi:uncharacterized protein JCM10292_004055 [Rhodotorula paludigena]|uniref:uncharacterized protein n=1 Tax=Rhodotorula paludigena TaxID=86838 RepID=UPI003179DE42